MRDTERGALLTKADVPVVVRAAARKAFELRDRDVRALDLFADTLVDGTSRVEPRRLRFLDAERGADLTVLVRELPQQGLVSLDIVVAPAFAFVTEVQNDEGPVELAEVSPGRWAAGPLRHGLTSLVVDGTGSRLWTAWFHV